MTVALRLPTSPPVVGAGRDLPAVRIDGLSKRFRVHRGAAEILRHPGRARYAQALSDVTLDVAQGEFFGILGANGAGKTTLFRVLATSLLPDSGTATVLGHDIERGSSAVRRLVSSVMANEGALQWRLSAAENLYLHAALHGMRRRDAKGRIAELLALVELEETGSAMAATFSSGMVQRLLVALALVPRPRVLLLDEPTRRLDPLVARDLRRFLRERLVDAEGCTVLLATHSGEEAMGLCDRVAILDAGKVLAVGTPERIGRLVGDRRFAVWTRGPEHPAFARMEARGLIADRSVLPSDEEGWSCVHLAIPGDTAAAARVLDLLRCAGVEVARFERAPLALADLIERVVARSRARRP